MTTSGMSNISRALAISLILLAVSGLNLADANSSGKTGAATGSGCFCHNTDAMIMPTMNGNPSSYTPGATYSISWSGSGLPASGQGGFNLVASAGSWSNLGGLVKQVSGELTHSSDGQRSWTADWTAPAAWENSAHKQAAQVRKQLAKFNEQENSEIRGVLQPRKSVRALAVEARVHA